MNVGPADPDPDPASLLSRLLLILALLLTNAFFAAAEAALVSVNKNKIKLLAESGDRRAAKLKKHLGEQTRFLSTTKVAITLAGFLSSAFAAEALAPGLAGAIEKWGVSAGASSGIAVAAITVALCFLMLALGELYPGRVAVRHAEKVALAVAGGVCFFRALLFPFIKLLSAVTNGLLFITGVKTEGGEESISKEEFKSLVETGQENGVLNDTESEMLSGVFSLGRKNADNIMTPRTDVYMINVGRPLSEYIDEMLTERYSRVPAYEDDIDNIVGVLYMKDFLLEARRVGFDGIDVRSLLHPAYFVPERKSVDELFAELKDTKTHMAILIDEYGGFSGLVTMEDLIEEIIGEIDDEYDADEPELRKVDETTFLIKGLLSIDDINDELGTELDAETEDYDTLGGLLTSLLGHVPTEEDIGAEIEYEGVNFKIELVTEKRIELVKAVIPPRGEPPDGGERDKARDKEKKRLEA